MKIQTRSFNNPTPNNPEPNPKPPSDGHHHGSGLMSALHVGHDLAMIGMSVDCCPEMAHPAMAHDHGAMGHDHGAMGHDHGAMGHDHGAMGHDHGGAGCGLSTATAALSAAVAVGSAIHGAQMLASDDTLMKLEGANHLLMSASCGAMAAQMFTGNVALAPWSTGLMAAHGLGEVALGVHQIYRGRQEECTHQQWLGLTKAVHGGCLAAAQLFPGAALPLYLGMGAATVAQISVQAAA